MTAHGKLLPLLALLTGCETRLLHLGPAPATGAPVDTGASPDTGSPSDTGGRPDDTCPVLFLSTTSLTWYLEDPEDTTPQALTVWNACDGQASLWLHASLAPGSDAAFTLRDTDVSVDPGATSSVSVAFRPDSRREYRGRILVTTNAAAQDDVSVDLFGVVAEEHDQW